MKSTSLWTYRIQLIVLIGLIVTMLTPYVSAQVDIPSLPSSGPSSLPLDQLPAGATDQVAQAQTDVERQVREQQRTATQSANDALRQRLEQVDVPANPVNALRGDSPEAAVNVARLDGLRAVDESLATSDMPPADAAALVQGDASTLVDNGKVTNPAAINRAVAQANRVYTNAQNESLYATAQANWASGVKGLANCASGDDNGKDFCQSLDDLKVVLNDIKSDMDDIVNKSHRLQAYVAAKPAFLNRPSLTKPVCNGLIAPGLNVPLTPVAIADTDTQYDPASGRLTLEAVKNEFLAAGNIAENRTDLVNSGTALGNGINLIRNNNGLYQQNVAGLQGSYDALTKRIWQNFDTTLKARFSTFKKHTEEMKTLADQLSQIERMLAQRPRTP